MTMTCISDVWIVLHTVSSPQVLKCKNQRLETLVGYNKLSGMAQKKKKRLQYPLELVQGVKVKMCNWSTALVVTSCSKV